MTELEEKKLAWEALKASPAWRWLIEIAQAQIDAKNMEVLSPMQPGQEYNREWLKGFASGMYAMGMIPDTQIELLEIDIKRAQDESEA